MLMRSQLNVPKTKKLIELCIYGSIVDFVIRVSYPDNPAKDLAPELGCLRVRTLGDQCIVTGILDEEIVGDSRYCQQLVNLILEENMEITETVSYSVQVTRQISLCEMSSNEGDL